MPTSDTQKAREAMGATVAMLQAGSGQGKKALS